MLLYNALYIFGNLRSSVPAFLVMAAALVTDILSGVKCKNVNLELKSYIRTHILSEMLHKIMNREVKEVDWKKQKVMDSECLHL